MDVHKPKPVRSWRELLTEIGIIVLSVCIALSAEQAVEWWHWRTQVQQAREVLATELAGNIGRGAERVVLEQCIEQHLDRAADILDAASHSGILPPVADIGASPQRPWTSGAWNSVVSSQVASHFPRAQLTDLGMVYERIREESETNLQEVVAWTDLSAMMGPGRHLDPPLDSALHMALGRAREANRFMAVVGGQLARAAQRLDLPYSDEDRKIIADAIRRGHICRPMALAIPPRYGQAPYAAFNNVLRDWQNYPPYR
jgi:hypothetical protein